jgi:drug/metabolite transporter (DMT)-like permease
MSDDGSGGRWWSPRLALHAAALAWGSQHVIIKGVVVDGAAPSLTNAVRFFVAAAISLPLAPQLCRPAADGEARSVWRAGAELGLWMFLGFALQAVGLQYTTASRSAFLLYLNVKLVPVLGFFCCGRHVPWKAWASAAIALAGTMLIAYDGSPPNVGDAWSLAAAVASALFILRLEDAASTTMLGAAALNAATLATSALLCVAWALVEPLGSLVGAAPRARARWTYDVPETALELLREQWAPLLYLALVPTVACNWLQTHGQRSVRAQDAAVIFALDPVYGAAFAWLLRGEELGTNGYGGIALVLVAVALSYSQDAEPPKVA